MHGDKLWFEDKQHAADSVFEYLDDLNTVRQHIVSISRANYGLYDGHGHSASDGTSYDRLSPLRYRDDSYVSENVVKSSVDTAMSLIAANPTRVAFATDGADFTVHRKARNLERYVEGVDRANNGDAMLRAVARDGTISPCGFMKIIPDYKRGIPVYERVLIDEMYVDEWGCRTSPPKEMIQLLYVDKRRLAAKFPKHKEAIMGADAVGLPVSDGSQPSRETLCRVVEAYRCPSEPGGDDGVKMIALKGGYSGGTILHWEKWTRDEPPFVWFSWTMPTIGFWGTSLVDEIAGIQMRIHKDNKRWDEIVDRLAYPTTWVQSGDADLQAKLVPGVGRVGVYRTSPPETVTPPTIPPDLLQRHRELEEQSRRLPGLSDFAAFSKKPSDVRSGPGFREVHDSQSQRLVVQHKQLEDLKLAIARHVIATSKEMAESGVLDKGPEVAWRSKNIAKRIKWADVDLEADRYVMHTQAVSILSRSFPGRKDFVMEMVNAGMMQPDRALALLDIPDLTKENELATAEKADIEATIEKLEDGEMVKPDPYQNLQMGLQDIKRNYLRIRHMGAPADILRAHEQWLELAQQMVKEDEAKAMAEQQAAAQAMQPQQPADPMAAAEDQIAAQMGL